MLLAVWSEYYIENIFRYKESIHLEHTYFNHFMKLLLTLLWMKMYIVRSVQQKSPSGSDVSLRLVS